MGDPDNDLKSAEEFVLNYVAAREHWERWANGAFEGMVAAGTFTTEPDPIQASYQTFLAQYVAPDVIEGRRAYFGEPPSVNRTATTVTSVVRSRNGAIVSTVEHSTHSQDEVEYELGIIAGRWTLKDRRTKDDDGSWVRGLF